jgi:hypothetical protein
MVAARTLMQALLGGLCNLAQRIGRDEGRVAAVAVESGGAPDVTG